MKPREVVRQRRTRAPQSELQPADLPDAPLDATSQARLDALAAVHLTMDEAAAYLRYEGERSADAVRRRLQTLGVKLIKPGRRYLVRRQVLDALMEHERGVSPRDVHARSVADRMAGGKATFFPSAVGRR